MIVLINIILKVNVSIFTDSMNFLMIISRIVSQKAINLPIQPLQTNVVTPLL